ncbi:hypothetical protein D3C80_1970250 [compost metagenome]
MVTINFQLEDFGFVAFCEKSYWDYFQQQIENVLSGKTIFRKVVFAHHDIQIIFSFFNDERSENVYLNISCDQIPYFNNDHVVLKRISVDDMVLSTIN